MRTLHIRTTHRRHVQIHATSKFLNCPRLIANDSISVGCAMSRTTVFPYLTLALAHVIVVHRTSQHYSLRGPNS